MPIRPPIRLRASRALIVGISGFLIGVTAVAIIIVLNQRGDIVINTNVKSLRAGGIAQLEEQLKVAPGLLANPNSKGKSIFIQKDGSDWIAFEAQLGACPTSLDWNASQMVFKNPTPKNENERQNCPQDILVSKNGCLTEGKSPQLIHFKTRIQKDDLFVELSNPLPDFCN